MAIPSFGGRPSGFIAEIIMKETKAVLTFTVIDKHGEKTVCNMIEPLDITLAKVHARIDDLLKSFDLTGNITLQFVMEDKL